MYLLNVSFSSYFKKRCKSTHLLRKQQEKLDFKFYSNFTWLRKLREINLL